MKQLLFLLLFPAFAMAQYTGNAGQKITLGEQTTADGLIWRGRLADTANLLTNKLDTSVYIVLDTGTRAMWYYRASTTPKWTRLVDSLNNLQGQLSLTSKVTGTLPVANGGTNTSTAFTAGSVVFAGASGTYSQDNSNLFWDNTNKRLGIGTTSPTTTLDVNGKIRATDDVILAQTTPRIDFDGGATGALRFLSTSTGNIRMVIQSGGNVGINTTTPTTTLDVNGKIRATDDVILSQTNPRIDFDGGATGALRFLSTSTGNIRMVIQSDGNVGIGTTSPQSGYRLHVVDSVYVGGNVSASAYTTRSDYDLKDEIQNISYGINEVMQMQPVKYTYKSNGSTQLGFIAQDLGVITPEVVSFEDKMSVYYNALIPILTKAIQEQNAIIKALEQRLLILENK